jgi:uncharacterized membrane protein YgcG
MRSFLTSLVLSLLVFATSPVCAEERILAYDIDLFVETNGDLRVTETILVNAENYKIRRGIYRDFPTQYRRALGFSQFVDFDVERVTRNGRAEPHFIETQNGFSRLFIGDANRSIPRGQHVYEITYRTREQLGFSQEGTELYWNLIGTEWAFPISRVNATIHLPSGAAVHDLNVYAGFRGEDNSTSARATRSGNQIYVENGRPLAPGEGLTVSVVWQNGLVTPPSSASKVRDFLGDNVGILIGLLATLGIAYYFERTWRRYGQDPEKGVIIPLFEPPAALSPVALGYIHERGFSGGVSGSRALTVAITSLAIKGLLTIAETSKGYDISLQDKEAENLPPGEALLLSRLKQHANGNVVSLDGDYDSDFLAIKKAYLAIVKKEYTDAYFRTNGGKWFAGAAMTAFALIATAALNQQLGEPALVAAGLTAFFGIAFAMFLSIVRNMWLTWRDRDRGSIFLSLFGWLCGSIALLIPTSLLATGVVMFAGEPVLVVAIALVALSTCFFWLMEAPTVYGRQIMDQIEGYLLFLTTTEWDRLKAREPMPVLDPSLFERHLAYSMALGVDQAWSQTFTKYATAAAMPPVDYHPSWYHSKSGGSPSFSRFSTDFSSGLSSSFSSASSPPPSSSSGSMGGGSSGGGGGGGGGGGW